MRGAEGADRYTSYDCDAAKSIMKCLISLDYAQCNGCVSKIIVLLIENGIEMASPCSVQPLK
jgi:DNA-directed RNA polymerase subunit RPC12/RpoP